MLKLCLANAIFVINYPRKKNCSVLHSTTYLPCHLLPVGVSHLLGLIPGKKNYIQLTCFMPTYYQSSWAMISFSIFSLNCIPKKCKQACHIRAGKAKRKQISGSRQRECMRTAKIGPDLGLATNEIATKDRTWLQCFKKSQLYTTIEKNFHEQEFSPKGKC